MRAFLAIPLLPEAGAAIRSLQESLGSLPALAEFRWIPPQNIHLTLRFLGEIGEPEARQAAGAMEAAAREGRAFEMPLERFGVFPHLRNPNVLWVGPQECPQSLEEFAGRLFQGLTEAGFPPEDRLFRPHLTIGRRRGKGRPPAGLEGELDAAEHRWLSPPLRLWMKEAVLLRSELRPGGALYTAVHSSPLS